MKRKTILAVYRDGAFHPIEPRDLPEGTMGKVVALPKGVTPPEEPDPKKRRAIGSELVRDMMAHPLPPNAPRFTRDELHERRRY